MTKKKKTSFVYGKPTTKIQIPDPQIIVGVPVVKSKRGRPKKQLFDSLIASRQEKISKEYKDFLSTINTIKILTPPNKTEVTYPHANDPILTPEIHLLANGAIDPFPEIMEVTQAGIDPIAIVHWKTAGKSSGLKKMITVGFITRKDTERITIAQTTSDIYTKKGVFNIPMSLVTRIEKLTEQKIHNILW